MLAARKLKASLLDQEYTTLARVFFCIASGSLSPSPALQILFFILLPYTSCLSVLFLISIKIMYLLIFGCAGSPLLPTGFPSCSEQGLLFPAVRTLIAVASLAVEQRCMGFTG